MLSSDDRERARGLQDEAGRYPWAAEETKGRRVVSPPMVAVTQPLPAPNPRVTQFRNEYEYGLRARATRLERAGERFANFVFGFAIGMVAGGMVLVVATTFDGRSLAIILCGLGLGVGSKLYRRTLDTIAKDLDLNTYEEFLK